MKNYIKLMRCKHYIKNFLIFLPIVFGKQIFNMKALIPTIIGTISFCLVSSIVYIVNDIMDVEADRKHEKKKNRPIASGAVSIKNAYILVGVLAVIAIVLNIVIVNNNYDCYLWLLTYLILNILYSIKLKHLPIIDIVILASGFLIRVLYGASIASIEVSNWLYLTILSISFYMGLGKRRNEYTKLGKNGREVLKYYNKSFLDNNMYMCLALAIVFYSLWCLDINLALNGIINIIWTVPIVIIICMKYSLIVEGDSYGDPVEVLLGDKFLILMSLLYALLMFAIIYF